MDKKNSWTCPEIFRSIGKKRLPGSNGKSLAWGGGHHQGENLTRLWSHVENRLPCFHEPQASPLPQDSPHFKPHIPHM